MRARSCAFLSGLVAMVIATFALASSEPYVVITEFPVSKNKIIYVSEGGDLCPTPNPQKWSKKWSKRWIETTNHESFSLADCPLVMKSRLAGCEAVFREEFSRRAPEAGPHDTLMLLRLNAKGRIGLLISQYQSGSGGHREDWILYEVSSSNSSSSKPCHITPLHMGNSLEDVGATFHYSCKRKHETLDNCYLRLFHNPSDAFQLQFWEDRVERKNLPSDVNWPRSRDRIWQ
jgi:hypothetical protein